jgi:perosamine synthetase
LVRLCVANKSPRVKRDAVIENLYKQGIATKPYLPSIHLFDFYRKKFEYKPGDFPISESISKSAIALPLYIGLTNKDIKYISEKVIETIKKHDERI